MVAANCPERVLELCINQSAADDILSQRERKQILRALQEVEISPKELIEYSFYFAEQVFREEQRFVTNWLRDFVVLANQADLPKPFLAKGVWFSPGSGIRNVLLEAIKTAEKTLDVCVYNLTDDRLANALLAAMDRGVQVTILTERASMLQRGSEIANLRNRGANTIVVERSQRLMHHKYLIVDRGLRGYVLSGSYNWTNSAIKNDENLALISEEPRVRQYIENFQTMLERGNSKK